MRIALVDVCPDSNKGACALTWAALQLLARAFPGASVALLPIAVTPPEAAPFRHTLRRFDALTVLPPLFDGEGRRAPVLVWRLLRSLRQLLTFDRNRRNAHPALEWIRGCDLVVSVGGVTFLTSDGTPRHDPRLLIRCLPLLAAQRAGVPTALVGQQIGPFVTRFGRWLCRRIAAQARLVLPRDVLSAEALAGLEVRSRLLPDSALALALRPDERHEPWHRRGLDPAVPTLALVVSSALRADESAHDHVGLCVELARALLAAGEVRQVLVVLQTDEDRAISIALVEALGLEQRCFIDDDLDPEQLSNLYGACRLVVSSRLHAVLLALLAGVPALSLAPEVTFKERAVLAMLGLESLWLPSGAGAQRAVPQCLALAKAHAAQRHAVIQAVAAARAQWDAVPPLLRQIVATHDALRGG